MKHHDDRRFRSWVARNPYTISFLALMFILTWALEIVLGVVK